MYLLPRLQLDIDMYKSTSDMHGEAHHASGPVPVPSVLIIRQAPATGATTFLSLPRELRDLIYFYLFEAVYTRCRKGVNLAVTPLDAIFNRAEATISDRLALMQASRGLWEEGSRILYGEHLFRFHVGSTAFDSPFLTQRAVNLMQDIEISLGSNKSPDSIRILQLFGTSQTPRKSCVIKLQFRELELMHDTTIEALRKLTGFQILTFEVDAPVFARCRQPGATIPWVSGLLAYMKDNLTLELGPSVYTNVDGHRRLVFKPQEHQPFHKPSSSRKRS